MREFAIYRAGREGVLLERVDTALSVWERFRGLMLRRQLAEGHGLLLPDCRSIHTCFMRFPIDVVYLDEDNCVSRIIPRMRPWRISVCWAARFVLEAPAGWSERVGLKRGDVLRFDFAEHSHPDLEREQAPAQTS